MKPPPSAQPARMESPDGSDLLLNPFSSFSTAKVLSLKATVLLLLTLLIKSRVQIAAGSAIGIFLLLQTLVFLAISGGMVLVAGGAAVYAMQQRRPATA